MRDRRSVLMGMAATMASILVGSMLAAPARAAGPTITIRQGDTLSAIAARYGVSLERLVALNALPDPNLLHPGQQLQLPGAPVPMPTARSVRYVVRPGEHLTGIAARHGSTIAAIVAANRLANEDLIFPGQVLTIPLPATASDASGAATDAAAGAPSTTPAPGRTVLHTIRSGETLTGIAAQYRTTISALIRLNHLADPGRIFAGEVMLIAVASSAPAEWSTDRFPAEVQAQIALRSAVRDAIVAEAHRARVPVRLALAVAWQESGWRQGLVSSAGAVGVMQLLPATADWIGGSLLGAPVDVHATRSNIRAGVTLLHHYLVRYAGDQQLALAAYYQGQRAVDEHGIYPVSRPYIASVVTLEKLFAP